MMYYINFYGCCIGVLYGLEETTVINRVLTRTYGTLMNILKKF